MFYISILALITALARGRRRVAVTDLLLIGGFLWLGWSGQRYVLWYAIAVTPILAEALAALREPPLPRRIERSRRRIVRLARWRSSPSSSGCRGSSTASARATRRAFAPSLRLASPC